MKRICSEDNSKVDVKKFDSKKDYEEFKYKKLETKYELEYVLFYNTN